MNVQVSSEAWFIFTLKATANQYTRKDREKHIVEVARKKKEKWHLKSIKRENDKGKRNRDKRDVDRHNGRRRKEWGGGGG